MPWMAGLSIEIILRKPLLTLLCSGALQGSSACLHYELTREAPGTMAAELAWISLHLLFTFPLSAVSAVPFPLSNCFLQSNGVLYLQ